MPSGYEPGAYIKGKAVNLGSTTLGAGTAVTADLDTAGYSVLVVMFRIGNATTPATAAGDCTASVHFYEDDGTTLFPAGIVAGISSDFSLRSASLTSNVAYISTRYNIAGVDKVQLRLTNSNVAPLQGATITYFLSRY